MASLLTDFSAPENTRFSNYFPRGPLTKSQNPNIDGVESRQVAGSRVQ